MPVDLRSVEVALLASGRVRDAAVIERSDSGRTRLIAYVVADEWLPVGELRSFLAERLSGHLIPSAFVLVEQLPSPTESRDWSALPVPSHTRPLDLDTPYAPPRNPVETALGELWALALGLDDVGVHDDFVDLGGDSFVAMRLLAVIEERFGRDLALVSIFDHPTIASFAREVFGTPDALVFDGPAVHDRDPGGQNG